MHRGFYVDDCAHLTAKRERLQVDINLPAARHFQRSSNLFFAMVTVSTDRFGNNARLVSLVSWLDSSVADMHWPSVRSVALAAALFSGLDAQTRLV